MKNIVPNKKITIIVPCYNEEATLPIFYNALKKIMDRMKYLFEVIMINDGSTDATMVQIENISHQDRRIKYLSFSKNFGKEAAMYAGFVNATGDYVVIMDADMQDPPELLPKMIDIIETGEYDSVATRRVNREGEPIVRSFFARRFYKLINKISDAHIVDGARDFHLMKREMVDAIVSMSEYNRFSKGIFGWIGYRTYWLSYENVERAAGKTKWNFGSLFKYGVDGIINFSHIPLSIASWSGVFMTFVSFIAIIFVIARRIIWGDPVAGWASTICIVIFMGGIQLLALGIMGQYIAKIYAETKKRPHYIIADSNFERIDKIR